MGNLLGPSMMWAAAACQHRQGDAPQAVDLRPPDCLQHVERKTHLKASRVRHSKRPRVLAVVTRA